MIPKFLRTLNRLGHGNALAADSIGPLEDQFRDFDKELTKTLKADRNLAFTTLVSTINSLLPELKHIEIQFAKAEKALNKYKSKHRRMVADDEIDKARNEWLREKGIEPSQQHSLKSADNQRKVILEQDLEFFRSLLIFADGSKRHLLFDRLVNDFSGKLSDPQIAPLIAHYFPTWDIDRIAVEANLKGKSSKKGAQKRECLLESFLKEQGKRLLPYLLEEYKDGKPKNIAAMLYVLDKQDLLKLTIEQQQETWINSINTSFGFKKVLRRQSVYKHINIWNTSKDSKIPFVEKHHQNLLGAMSRL